MTVSVYADSFPPKVTLPRTDSLLLTVKLVTVPSISCRFPVVSSVPETSGTVNTLFFVGAFTLNVVVLFHPPLPSNTRASCPCMVPSKDTLSFLERPSVAFPSTTRLLDTRIRVTVPSISLRFPVVTMVPETFGRSIVLFVVGFSEPNLSWL